MDITFLLVFSFFPLTFYIVQLCLKSRKWVLRYLILSIPIFAFIIYIFAQSRSGKEIAVLFFVLLALSISTIWGAVTKIFILNYLKEIDVSIKGRVTYYAVMFLILLFVVIPLLLSGM